MKIVEIESLPEAVRGGKRKPSAESLEIEERIKTLKPQAIAEFAGKPTAMAQRIRSAAKRAGLDVAIRNDDGVIKFQGIKPTAKAKVSK